MTYPTYHQVLMADRYHICLWYRCLRSAETEEEEKVQIFLSERFKEVDGFTPLLSKEIGWDCND